MSTTKQLSPFQQTERRKCIDFLIEQEHPQSAEDADALTEQWEQHSYEDLLEARRYNRKRMRRERRMLEAVGARR